MQQVQGTFLGKDGNKITFATPDGKVLFGFAQGECTLVPQTLYTFTTDVKTSKAGKQYTVITGAVDGTGKAVEMAKKKAWGGKGGGGKYDSEGMKRGNYQKNVTQYICTCLAKGIQPDISWFNSTLKNAETAYFAKPVVQTQTQPPVAAQQAAPIANAAPLI